jgi:uncharacterized protein YbaR (Trm112 family)
MTKEDDTSDSDRSSPQPQIDRHLLQILVCPLTKAPLVYDEARQELISRKAALAYPIRNGVPLMTQEAARQLSDDEMLKR